MSQNLDATAINQIHALISAQGVNEIISKIGADAVALPENFRIHDLEKFNLNRFRFRGALSTASIDDFTRYSKDLADEGTRCFIDADNMRAVSVLTASHSMRPVIFSKYPDRLPLTGYAQAAYRQHVKIQPSQNLLTSQHGKPALRRFSLRCILSR